MIDESDFHDYSMVSNGDGFGIVDHSEEGDWLPESSFEIMQFTGLHDKNGKEIYEGDVISFEDKYQYYVIYEDAKFVCKHAAKSNSLQGIIWGPLHRFFDPDFLVYGGVEVIGNIHEHPELLKQ